MVIFYKKWKKYNDIQLTKKKDSEQSKNEKIAHPPEIYFKLEFHFIIFIKM